MKDSDLRSRIGYTRPVATMVKKSICFAKKEIAERWQKGRRGSLLRQAGLECMSITNRRNGVGPCIPSVRVIGKYRIMAESSPNRWNPSAAPFGTRTRSPNDRVARAIIML